MPSCKGPSRCERDKDVIHFAVRSVARTERGFLSNRTDGTSLDCTPWQDSRRAKLTHNSGETDRTEGRHVDEVRFVGGEEFIRCRVCKRRCEVEYSIVSLPLAQWASPRFHSA